MIVSELLDLLARQPSSSLRFLLPNGEAVPAHFHLTEVGRVERTFIDCGGSVRSTLSCSLQLWVANDVEHRLKSDRFLSILQAARSLLRSIDLQVEVEFGEQVIATYTIGDTVSAFGTIQFRLVGKKTDCLAKDKCGIEGCTDDAACC
jgi:hypothetical protein